MKAVVTGGAGFIGSNLAAGLLAAGHDVNVVDDLSTGHAENVPEEAAFHEASILDPAALSVAFRGADVVFHQAAIGSVPRSMEKPLASHEANLTGTLHVLEAARRAGVRKVVYAASSSAYGDAATLPKTESMAPRPLSPYAVTKLAGEHYAQVYTRAYGLATTCLRYFNVYGPRQDPNGPYAAVIPKFILAALDGKPLTIHGDGRQVRDFTFVADAVQANLLAMRPGAADGEVVNVGTGQTTEVNELARAIVELTGSRSEVLHGPERPGDIRDSLASLERARDLLGYGPTVDIRQGLRQTIAWFRGRAAQP